MWILLSFHTFVYIRVKNIPTEWLIQFISDDLGETQNYKYQLHSMHNSSKWYEEFIRE